MWPVPPPALVKMVQQPPKRFRRHPFCAVERRSAGTRQSALSVACARLDMVCRAWKASSNPSPLPTEAQLYSDRAANALYKGTSENPGCDVLSRLETTCGVLAGPVPMIGSSPIGQPQREAENGLHGRVPRNTSPNTLAPSPSLDPCCEASHLSRVSSVIPLIIL